MNKKEEKTKEKKGGDPRLKLLLLTLSSGELLSLFETAARLGTVTAFLQGLAGGALLLAEADTTEAVDGFSALGGSEVVIDDTEGSGRATTELGLETEDVDALFVGDLVHGGELLDDGATRDGTVPVGVGDIDDELTALEEGVLLEALGADGEVSLLLSGSHFFCGFVIKRFLFRVERKEKKHFVKMIYFFEYPVFFNVDSHFE